MRRCALLVHLLLLILVLAAAGAAASSRLAGGAPGSAGAPDGVPAEHVQCLEDLLPCTAYLKTAKHPSQTCCTAMHNAAATEMPCLCRLFANPELLSDFNVTQDQMFRLPARCGLPVGCRAGATAAHDPGQFSLRTPAAAVAFITHPEHLLRVRGCSDPWRLTLECSCVHVAVDARNAVVEAPPPPAGTHHHQHGASPRSSEFWSVWRVAASVVLGQMVLMAAVF